MALCRYMLSCCLLYAADKLLYFFSHAHCSELVMCFFDPAVGLGDKKNCDVEHFKTRFSVHRIRELAPTFTDTQREWIHDAGVGALLSMSAFSVPVKLVQWIMKHIDPLLSEFRLKNKVFVIDRPLVCKILELQNGTRPLNLFPDPENMEAVMPIRDQYKEGDRAKLKKCIEVLKASKDRESFIRSFMLLALGTVYCPGTSNDVSMKYVNSLIDTSELQTYDWAGHIIEVLMDEVKKYQNFSPARLQQDHQMGSCLPILAVFSFLHYQAICFSYFEIFLNITNYPFLKYVCADCLHGPS